MEGLTRISISLESALLDAFDHSITAQGYATRSEAIRDLIRDRLVREEEQRAGGEGVAVVTLVYDHHARELAARLIEKQHHHHNLVVSSLHVHLGERHCLEVSVLRGPMEEVPPSRRGTAGDQGRTPRRCAFHQQRGSAQSMALSRSLVGQDSDPVGP